MAVSNVDQLKEAGVVSMHLTDSEEEAIGKLSQEDIDHLIRIRKSTTTRQHSQPIVAYF
jgi:Fe2+ or Zn2+ uptake regulation protein